MQRFISTILLAFLALASAQSTPAQTYKVLHNFGGPGDGWEPLGTLVFDSNGNLYGTTEVGGYSGPRCYVLGCGTIFKLTPNADGTWNENLIFRLTGTEGNNPSGSLTFDLRRNLCSTTQGSGAYGYGTAFELTPDSNGTWSASVLHAFTGSWDGASPQGGITFGEAGQIYGTTTSAGLNGHGTVFSLGQTSALNWYELVLHAFAGGDDGGSPSFGTLTIDASGNLYGATVYGGSRGYGTVFELTPSRVKSGWTETVLYSFTGGADGAEPWSGVAFDAAGNLYGTTTFGGVGGGNGGGVVFRLAPNGDGTWTESVLHAFQGSNDGLNPSGGLTFDSAGNLYGTTQNGGSGGGTIFKLQPSGGGQWTETILYSFDYSGVNPFGGVALDNAGNLYGTTVYGGKFGDHGGVAYELTP
jgi:uncharacterized repeat protein (TIGR03803 family)